MVSDADMAIICTTKEQMEWARDTWRPMMTVGKAVREKLDLPALKWIRLD